MNSNITKPCIDKDTCLFLKYSINAFTEHVSSVHIFANYYLAKSTNPRPSQKIVVRCIDSKAHKKHSW